MVGGGPFGSFDLPAVRAFIRIFAPRRGEIVVDAESLDLRAPRSREPDPDRPKAPRRKTRRKAAPPAEAEESESPEALEPSEPAETAESAGPGA